MKAYLAVLRHGGLSSPTLRSIIDWVTGLPTSDIQWRFVMGLPDADVARARSQIASDFLRQRDADCLVMADYDVQFDPADLDYLVRAACEKEAIVGAVVPVKGAGQNFGCRFIDGEPHELLTDDLVELRPPAFMGGALTAYHRSVFEAIIQQGMRFCPAQRMWPFFMPTIYKNPDLQDWEYLSEDWAACLYAHEVGKRTFAAMRPFVMHHGKAAFTPFIANPHEVDCAQDMAAELK